VFDGSSCNQDIYGCPNPWACNYDPDATIDDGSCLYEGCTDPLSENCTWYCIQCEDGGYADCQDDATCEYEEIPEPTCVESLVVESGGYDWNDDGIIDDCYTGKLIDPDSIPNSGDEYYEWAGTTYFMFYFYGSNEGGNCQITHLAWTGSGTGEMDVTNWSSGSGGLYGFLTDTNLSFTVTFSDGTVSEFSPQVEVIIGVDSDTVPSEKVTVNDKFVSVRNP
jgi:hypothetical protein